MFFSISTEKFDDRFFKHIQISDYYISLDAGWHQAKIDNKEIFYKGYCDTKAMNAVAVDFANDPTPRYTGNFGIIIVDQDSLIITHDINRSFPLNIDSNNFLTNISKLNSIEPIWADRYVIYKDKKINFIAFNPYPEINFEESLSIDDCAQKIKNILDNKVEFFKDSKIPNKLFVSGGLDTTLLYAVAKTHKLDFDILSCEHIDYDKFLLKNYSRLKKEYAVYNQMHVFKQSTFLFCGAPGDEYFMRGPYVAGLWAAWHGVDLIELLEQNNYYHKKHFLKDSNVLSISNFYQKQTEIKNQYTTYHDLCTQILNINVNDHQMWHINNTTMWTPFKDLEILNIVLQLNKNDLIEQIIDGKLSKKIISLYDSELVKIVDRFKNYNSYCNIFSDPTLSKIFE